jgi:hypothetical protein
VVAYQEHTEGGGATHTQCRDTSITGPYPKTVGCTTTGGSISYRDTLLEVGGVAYTASCDCDPLLPGEYKARWKDKGQLDILSIGNKGELKSHRYRITSAKQIIETMTQDNKRQSPCGGLTAVNVSSVPAGAEILVDDKFRGNTPSSFELPDGDHEIVIQREGFKTWKKHAGISGGRINVTAEMEKKE